MLIGITGSISTGKSVVTDYLIKCGFNVIDADKLAKAELYDPEVINELVDRFGNDILIKGRIDRQALGQLVFQDEEARKILNAIIHPRVIKKMKDRIQTMSGLVFLDIPLLYETGLEQMVDKVIVVYTSQRTQLQRLMKRDDIDESFALQKIATQMDIETKRQRADFIVNNEDDLTQTYLQIDDIIRRLQNEI
ncbi:MAG: dephospho-CoA kinase [Acholeplasmataceae bacterium]|nr:dephospho-CoA kinase [Acholeplasmataceae bacterium]